MEGIHEALLQQARDALRIALGAIEECLTHRKAPEAMIEVTLHAAKGPSIKISPELAIDDGVKDALNKGFVEASNRWIASFGCETAQNTPIDIAHPELLTVSVVPNAPPDCEMKQSTPIDIGKAEPCHCPGCGWQGQSTEANRPPEGLAQCPKCSAVLERDQTPAPADEPWTPGRKWL